MRASCSMRWNRRFTNAGPCVAAASSTIPIGSSTRLDQIHRAPGRGWHRAVGWQRWQFETINGLYKTEIIYRRRPWRSLEAVEFAALEWTDWFNNPRLLGPIGNIPPADAEERYYAMLEQLAMAA